MVRSALRRPITIIVFFLGVLIFSVMAIRTIPIDIFPKLNLTYYLRNRILWRHVTQTNGRFFLNPHAGPVSLCERNPEY